MARIEVKDDTVNIWGLQPQMRPVLRESARIWAKHGKPHVVTGARDGIHSPSSLHYYGLAVDLRTWEHTGAQWGMEDRKRIVSELTFELAKISEHYQVVIHPTHIHVEYDES